MAPRFSIAPARWFLPDSPLSSTDRLVLSVLCIWTNRDTGQCFPKIRTLVECAKVSERSVRASIGHLESFGAISVQRRYDDTGRSTSNLYTVLGYDPPGVGAPGAGYGAGNSKRWVQDSSTNVVTTNTSNNVSPAEMHPCTCTPERGYAPGSGSLFLIHDDLCPAKRKTA